MPMTGRITSSMCDRRRLGEMILSTGVSTFSTTMISASSHDPDRQHQSKRRRVPGMASARITANVPGHHDQVAIRGSGRAARQFLEEDEDDDVPGSPSARVLKTSLCDFADERCGVINDPVIVLWGTGALSSRQQHTLARRCRRVRAGEFDEGIRGLPAEADRLQYRQDWSAAAARPRARRGRARRAGPDDSIVAARDHPWAARLS